MYLKKILKYIILFFKQSSKVSPAPERRSLKDANSEKSEEQIENFEADLQGKHNEFIPGEENSNTSKIGSNLSYEVKFFLRTQK